MAKAKTLTTKDLQIGFNVGHMTIFNWRKGSATKDPLPCVVDEASRVTFKEADVKAWAKKHKLAFTAPTEATPESKPGPKAKVAPAKKASARKFDPATTEAIQEAAIKATGGQLKLKRAKANVAQVAQ